MAGWLSTYGTNAVLDGTAMPATLYGKLHTGNPTAAGTANAATETTRKSFTRAASSGGATSNVADMVWTNIAGSQDSTYLTLWDNVSAGNCWGAVPITANAYVAGDTFTIAAGDLDLALDIFA